MSDERDLQYRINTSGDDSGATKVQQALEKLIGTSQKLDKEKLAGFLKKGGELATFGAAVELVAKSLEEFAEKEAQVASLDAALAARAQLTDRYRESLQKLAAQQQEATSIPEAEWLKALTTLSQAGAEPENINKLIDASKNLAGILGGDLQSAAFAVGKALNGEFAAFSRIGIVVDENATQAKKLEQLWDQLAQRGGGQLEARAETLKGSFARLKNASSDLLSNIGGMLARVLPFQGFVNGAAAATNFLASIFGSTVPKAGALKNAIIATGAAMETQEEITKRFAKEQEAVKAATANAATEIDRETASLKANTEEANRVADAQAQLELKKIDIDEKSGKISPTEAAAKRGQINKKSEQDNFKREFDARAKEISMLETQTAQFVDAGDEANKKALDAKAKLDEMNRLVAERAKIAQTGEGRVQIAQNLYDSASGAEKKAASVELSRAKYNRDYSLFSFDQDHGKLDVASQTKIAQSAEEAALATNTQDVGPKVSAYRARIQALQDQQRDELRRHGFTDSANRLDQYAALKDAREKQRGEVKVGEDGSLQGSPAAIAVKRASDAYKNSAPPQGTAAYEAQLRVNEAQIARLQTFIERILKLPVITQAIGAKLNQAIDAIDILEAQNRNNPGRG